MQALVRLVVVLAAFTTLLSMPPAAAHEVKSRTLILKHPWTRATPPGADVAAGYMTIVNTGTEADRLIGGSAQFAARLELHEVLQSEDGIMRMRQLNEGIVIPPGATITLAPGGRHLMFTGLLEPLKQDFYVDTTLRFEKAGEIAVEFFVEPIGVKEPHLH